MQIYRQYYQKVEYCGTRRRNSISSKKIKVKRLQDQQIVLEIPTKLNQNKNSKYYNINKNNSTTMRLNLRLEINSEKNKISKRFKKIMICLFLYTHISIHISEEDGQGDLH
jgi:hypothetical protein